MMQTSTSFRKTHFTLFPLTKGRLLVRAYGLGILSCDCENRSTKIKLPRKKVRAPHTCGYFWDEMRITFCKITEFSGAWGESLKKPTFMDNEQCAASKTWNTFLSRSLLVFGCVCRIFVCEQSLTSYSMSIFFHADSLVSTVSALSLLSGGLPLKHWEAKWWILLAITTNLTLQVHTESFWPKHFSVSHCFASNSNEKLNLGP